MSGASRPKSTNIGPKELADLNVVAWRAGFMVIKEGSGYHVVRKPDLHAWMRSNVNVKAAVKVAPRLFRTGDGAKLRKWLADAIAGQKQEARP